MRWFSLNETSKSAALPHPVDIALPVNMVSMYERGHTIGKTPLSGREYIKIKIKKEYSEESVPLFITVLLCNEMKWLHKRGI